jgi:short subunit dehydrogenase-like uncharacterized protein
VLVYGATGFTGRLVVDELRRFGPPPVLGGRNASALERLRDVVGSPEVRVADAARPETLRHLCDGVGVVVNCAGPFTRLGEPVLRVAVEAGVHYVDTTGEQDYMARMMDLLSPDAQRRDVTAIVAQAFEYAIGDCLARVAVEETAGAATVEVFTRVEGSGATRGTRLSALEALAAPQLAVVNGRRHREAPGAHRSPVRFPDEDVDRLGVSFGGGEVLSAPSYAATVRTVRSYLVVPATLALALPTLLRFGTPLVRGRSSWLARRLAGRAAPPGVERRDQPWWVLARVRAPGGRGTRVTASGYDTYGTSAVIAALGARWLLEGRAKRPGVLTTAQAFDPRAFLDALADSGVAWRTDPLGE